MVSLKGQNENPLKCPISRRWGTEEVWLGWGGGDGEKRHTTVIE